MMKQLNGCWTLKQTHMMSLTERWRSKFVIIAILATRAGLTFEFSASLASNHRTSSFPSRRVYIVCYLRRFIVASQAVEPSAEDQTSSAPTVFGSSTLRAAAEIYKSDGIPPQRWYVVQRLCFIYKTQYLYVEFVRAKAPLCVR